MGAAEAPLRPSPIAHGRKQQAKGRTHLIASGDSVPIVAAEVRAKGGTQKDRGRKQKAKRDRTDEIERCRIKRVQSRQELVEFRSMRARLEDEVGRLQKALAAEKQRSASLLQALEMETSLRIRVEGELDDVRRNYRNLRRGWRQQATPFD